MLMPRELSPYVNLGRRKKAAIFVFLMISLFIATLDTQIVATAIPTIVGDLGQAEHYTWIPSSYILAQCAVMPVYGKFGDLFGRKYVLIAALAIFVTGSLACAASWSMGSLIAARVFQGLGTGGLLVSTFAVSADLFQPSERARFQSYLSLVYVLGAFTGPPLGGFVAETFGWRFIFLMTAPLGLLATLGFAVACPPTVPERKPRIDYAGAATVMTAVGSFVLWVNSGQMFAGFLTTASVAVAGVAALSIAAFVAVERSAAEPIIPLPLFSRAEFVLLCLATMSNGAMSIGLVYHHAYFLQMTAGLSPAEAGFFFVALTVGVTSGALLSGRFMAVRQSYATSLRISLGIGCLCLLLFSRAPVGTPIPFFAAGLLVLGFSIGFGMYAPMLGAQLSVVPAQLGAATGTITLVRMVGAAMANAFFGAVFIAFLASGPVAGVDDPTTITPTMLRSMDPATRKEVVTRFADAFSMMYLSAAAVAAAGFAAALRLRDGSR